MNWPATIANSLWLASSLPAATRFRLALSEPALTQERLLRQLIADNADSAYGRKHQFHRIQGYEDFAAQVPIVSYAGLEPWIEKIQAGEPRVLTVDPVTHLIPTSGSSGARKLIPFTRGLQREFDRAIAPWVSDLVHRHPDLLRGPAYWSISPPPQREEEISSVVPIGFASDADYLGGHKSWLVRSALASPRRLTPRCDLDTFRHETLLALLLAADLRLISVWHPSFLTLLLEALPGRWETLLSEITRAAPARAHSLRQANPFHPASIWPKLRVVSCWGDGMAEWPMAELRRRLPGVCLQAKGLLATEACVSIPIDDHHPVAVGSHFFEFIDAKERFVRIRELQCGESYEVIVTTGGGLWRYRLGDRVRVTGFLGETPSIRFLERAGNVSDLCGEKLSELFVAGVLKELFHDRAHPMRFALLAPDKTGKVWRYTLYAEGALPADAEQQLEARLLHNPHYEVCRRLGQLEAARIQRVSSAGYERYVSYLREKGMNLGDIKPATLSKLDVWSTVFN